MRLVVRRPHASSRYNCPVAKEPIHESFCHTDYQYNVSDSNLPHCRLRWVFAGLREDMARTTNLGILEESIVPKPIKMGCGDVYEILNKTLPNVILEDLTFAEWVNFKEYEDFLKETIELHGFDGVPAHGLCATFDVTRKMNGAGFDCAMRTNGLVGPLTTKDVKKMAMTIFDIDLPRDQREICRIIHNGERWLLQGRDASTRHDYSYGASDSATGEAYATTMVACSFLPILKQVEISDLILDDIAEENTRYHDFWFTPPSNWVDTEEDESENVERPPVLPVTEEEEDDEYASTVSQPSYASAFEGSRIEDQVERPPITPAAPFTPVDQSAPAAPFTPVDQSAPVETFTPVEPFSPVEPFTPVAPPPTSSPTPEYDKCVQEQKRHKSE